MTSEDKNVTTESAENDDEVLAPATPSAEGLPLSEDADEPSGG